jgi:hypothetical protein
MSVQICHERRVMSNWENSLAGQESEASLPNVTPRSAFFRPVLEKCADNALKRVVPALSARVATG